MVEMHIRLHMRLEEETKDMPFHAKYFGVTISLLVSMEMAD